MKYSSLGVDCTEYVYISFAEENKIILNEENIDYKRCTIDELIEELKWYDDKMFLKNVLSNAFNGEIVNKAERITIIK